MYIYPSSSFMSNYAALSWASLWPPPHTYPVHFSCDSLPLTMAQWAQKPRTSRQNNPSTIRRRKHARTDILLGALRKFSAESKPNQQEPPLTNNQRRSVSIIGTTPATLPHVRRLLSCAPGGSHFRRTVVGLLHSVAASEEHQQVLVLESRVWESTCRKHKGKGGWLVPVAKKRMYKHEMAINKT